jgi:predicted regulator of Ras-like GTPase activity (Roadblock/LC7/MglB family)
MSAVKSKFAGLLRGLLRHFDDNETEAANTIESATPAAPAAPAAPARPQPAPARFASRLPSSAAPANAPSPAPTGRVKAAEIVQEAIELPLQPIIAGLPLELRAKINSTGVAGGTISIPVERVLNQLAAGTVKISFGELRQLAPEVFANYGGEHDARSVALPLNQVLAQINPAMLARRSAQKRIEVSDEVAGPFEAASVGLKVSMEKAAAQPPPAAAPIPLSRLAPPVSAASSQPPPVAPPPAFAPRWTTPASNPGNRINGGNSPASNGPAKDANGSNTPPHTRPGGLAAPTPAAAPKAGSSSPNPVEQPLLVPLSAILENWPEALKLEISQLDLENAQVALPVNLVEPALKRGRIVFAWRDLRSWIKSAAVAVSVHDNTELELPLKVLAPLFFARQKNGAAGLKKAAVTQEIPDMFFGDTPPASQPAAPIAQPAPVVPPAPIAPFTPPMPTAVAAAIPPVDTNYFLRTVKQPSSDSEFVRKGGTDFQSRAAAPADIIARAMELPGVAGALITLADGLKVASQVPADLNGDTLAAFIPQIFARVNQGSRELRMGELNNLSFSVGSVPWKIFRVNAVYFAAFGRKNERLSGAPLAALAVQLDNKK